MILVFSLAGAWVTHFSPSAYILMLSPVEPGLAKRTPWWVMGDVDLSG
jgi:hypothetical protein